jgi:hypothetical protein
MLIDYKVKKKYGSRSLSKRERHWRRLSSNSIVKMLN